MTNLQTISNQRDIAWAAFLALALFVAAMVVPGEVMAATGDTPIGKTLCKLVQWINGPTGRAIATLAIIIIGVGALMGKVSWGMAIIVAIGIAIVFGAPKILEMLGAAGSDCGTGLIT